MTEEHLDLSVVPVGHVSRGLHLPSLGEALKDAGFVVLIGIEDKQVLPLVGFHQLREGGQLLLVDGDDRAIVVIDRAVRHLEELPGENCRCIRLDSGGHLSQFIGLPGVQLPVSVSLLKERDHLLRLQLLIGLTGRGVHTDVDGIVKNGRQGQPVLGAHGETEVPEFPINGVLGTQPQTPLIDHVALMSTGGEVAHPVVPHPLPQPLASVQQVELGPEVQVSVGGWSSGKAHHVAHSLDGLLQGLPSLCGSGLEGRQLIQDHHIIGEPAAQEIHKPDHVLPVDDVQIGRGADGSLSLLSGASDDTASNAHQVIPLLALLRPDVVGDILGCDD